MDAVYGNIAKQIPDSYLAKYDVISDEAARRLTGPFSIFRNVPKLTERWKLCGRKTEYSPVKSLLTNTHYKNFDEVGFHQCLIDQNDDTDTIKLNTGIDEGNLFQCWPNGGNECVWKADGEAFEDQLAKDQRRPLVYIHFHHTKKSAAGSLKGKDEAYLKNLVEHGWALHAGRIYSMKEYDQKVLKGKELNLVLKQNSGRLTMTR